MSPAVLPSVEASPANDGAGARAKKLRPGEGKTPVDDWRRIIKEQKCWRASEKLVLLTVRVCAWSFWACGRDPDELRLAFPGRAETLLHTKERISAAEIAGMCGEGCAKRSVQRALRIATLAGVLIPLPKKTDDGKENLPNHYAFDPQKLLELSGKNRPEEWAFQDKTGGGGSDTTDGGGSDTTDGGGSDKTGGGGSDTIPAPTEYAASAEAARLAAGRPVHDPAFARLGKLGRAADRATSAASRAAGRAASCQARKAARVAAFNAELAAVSPPAPPASTMWPASSPPPTLVPSTATPSPTAPAAAPDRPIALRPVPELAPAPVAPPLVEDELLEHEEREQPGADGLTREERRAFDGEILFMLEGLPLEAIATLRDARLIGVSARKRKASVELVREALEDLAWKRYRGRFPRLGSTQGIHVELLKLARRFVRVQWAIADEGPVDFAKARPSDEDLARADMPTADDLAAMRAHFGVSPEEHAKLRAEHEARAGARLLFDLAVDHVRARAPASFDPWFSGVQYDGLDDGELSLRASSEFVRDFVHLEHEPRLVEALARLLKRRVEVRWAVAELDDPIGDGPPPKPPTRRQ